MAMCGLWLENDSNGHLITTFVNKTHSFPKGGTGFIWFSLQGSQ